MEYQYSSYPDYVGGRGGTLCHKPILEEQFENTTKYHAFVEDSYESIKQRKDLRSSLID